VALPLLWRFADQPGDRLALVAIATMVAFLFRHDHGVFISCDGGAPADDRRPEGAAAPRRRTARSSSLLAPYLIFIQRNGGVDLYFRQASHGPSATAIAPCLARPFDNPEGISAAAKAGGAGGVVAGVRDNCGVITTPRSSRCSVAPRSGTRDAFRPTSRGRARDRDGRRSRPCSTPDSCAPAPRARLADPRCRLPCLRVGCCSRFHGCSAAGIAPAGRSRGWPGTGGRVLASVVR
jgi:hypothetical protein